MDYFVYPLSGIRKEAASINSMYRLSGKLRKAFENSKRIKDAGGLTGRVLGGAGGGAGGAAGMDKLLDAYEENKRKTDPASKLTGLERGLLTGLGGLGGAFAGSELIGKGVGRKVGEKIADKLYKPAVKKIRHLSQLHPFPLTTTDPTEVRNIAVMNPTVGRLEWLPPYRKDMISSLLRENHYWF